MTTPEPTAPAADHPHTDPGDGREQCPTCGKWVHLVTHSCKGVRVAPAAETLTEAEQEALLIASHTVEPVHHTGRALFAVVESILAAQRAEVTARLGDADVVDAVERALPLDFERHASQTIKDAALRDRRRLALSTLAAVRAALTEPTP